MIANHCYSKEWIDAKRAELRVADPGLLEKCIHALELLGKLSENLDWEFVFKGGTSLILLLPSFRRLSIDVDIVTPRSSEDYESILGKIGQSRPFLRYEEDRRGHDRLPKRRHYKFWFNSIYSRREDYVLLDILEEENNFPETQVLPIRSTFIEVEHSTSVRMPTIDCLAGDKLTAFAPTTVGVPLEEGSSMQVAKQLFDIGELIGLVNNLTGVAKTYDILFELENSYRGNVHTRENALKDTLQSCLTLSKHGLKGWTGDQSVLLLEGAKRLQNHLVRSKFGIDEARIAAGKTAFLATLLLSGKTNFNIKGNLYHGTPEDIQRIKKLSIPSGHLSSLNGIRKANPEAFHYWHLSSTINR